MEADWKVFLVCGLIQGILCLWKRRLQKRNFYDLPHRADFSEASGGKAKSGKNVSDRSKSKFSLGTSI